jgi:hypothetical protein
MSLVDPDGAVHQSRQFQIVRTGLELDQQTVPRRAPAARDRLNGAG